MQLNGYHLNIVNTTIKDTLLTNFSVKKNQEFESLWLCIPEEKRISAKLYNFE